MARSSKYHPDAILDAARTLLLAQGPAGVTAQSVATALGARGDWIYHRLNDNCSRRVNVGRVD